MATQTRTNSMRLAFALLAVAGALCAQQGISNPPSSAAILPLCSASVTTNCAANVGAAGNVAIGKGLLTQYGSYDAFGDSITYGQNASIPANDYVSLIGVALGLTPTNHGSSGSQAADQFDYIYPMTVSSTAAQLLTYMIGTNDNWIYAQLPNKEANFNLFDQAAIAFLAIPAGNKALGQSSGVTYTGTWTASGYYGGATSEVSTVIGSTATFSFYGPVGYLAYTMQDANGGTFTVAVDGGTAVAYSAVGTGGAAILTNHSRTYGSALLRFAGLTYSQHTVVMTVTSSTGAGNQVWFDWGAGALGNNFAAGPSVVVGGVPRQNPSLNHADSTTQGYSAMVKNNVAVLAADGLNVTYADTPSYLSVANISLIDGVHPNDAGYAQLTQAFLFPLNSASAARTKSGFVVSALTQNGNNLGINTVTPTAQLHIVGAANQAQLIVQENAVQTALPFQLLNSAGAALFTLGQYGGFASLDVGAVGASYTDGNSQLWVNNSQASRKGLRVTGFAGQTAPLLQWESSSAALGVINSSGYLGIGLTTPSSPVHVVGANTTYSTIMTLASPSASQQVQIGLQNGSALEWAYGLNNDGTFVIYDPARSGNDIVLTPNGNMTLMPSGGSVIVTGPLNVGGLSTALKTATTSNCIGTTYPSEACGSAAAGSSYMWATATTQIVATTAVTAASQILLQFDSSLGSRLSTACNTTFTNLTVTARTAGTNFTVTAASAPATNPVCFSWSVIN